MLVETVKMSLLEYTLREMVRNKHSLVLAPCTEVNFLGPPPIESLFFCVGGTGARD